MFAPLKKKKGGYNMGLFSNLLKTYDHCSQATGISETGKDGEINEKKTFLPLFHITLPTSIQITLDGDGNFISISRDVKEQQIIIPCTENSSSRAGSVVAPHPLCDQLGYVDKNIDVDKYKAYMEQLESWKGDNLKLNAIYTFLRDNSVANKLVEFDLLVENEKKQENVVFDKIVKLGIRFSVQIPNDFCSNVWQDNELRELWISCVSNHPEIWNNKLTADIIQDSFDYLSGEKLQLPAFNHPKNIIDGNAKLISCNDTSGYTFRGRFSNQEQATQIDAFSSQKTHQVLKWLINNYSSRLDSQITLIWAVDKNVEEVIEPYNNSFDLFGKLASFESATDKLENAELSIDANYAKRVNSVLKGYTNANKIKEHSKKIVVAIFDAATTGRMSTVFYQELPQNKYFENIAEWHEDSAWHQIGFKKETNEKGKEIKKPINYIGCPSFYDITVAIYGEQKGSADKGYNTLKKKMRKQLLECMFGNFAFPKNLIDMAAIRASSPFSFTDDKGSFSENKWLYSLNITCSLMKKYIKQNNKEEISMELEVTRQDRDYLFGRLLSVADRIEKVASYKASKNKPKDDKDKRATNAVRLLNIFSTKPYATWGVLWQQLTPYINQLNGASYYQSLIDEIMVAFKDGEFENNQPLSPLYLLGYSAQNRAFIQSKKEKSEEDENDNIE